jgi:signal transduction histidine kinase
MKQNRSSVQHLVAHISPMAWKPELEKASERYHLIGCWVAILFDPVFAFTDYINTPEHWKLLLLIRVCVSMLILVTVLTKDKLNLSTYVVVSVPFVLISLQNAFTYSLIGTEDLVGHNLNYMALFVGAAMFVLWRLSFSVVIVVVSGIATAWCIYQNPAFNTDEFFLKGGLLLLVVAIFMIALIQTRYQLTIREIKARLALMMSKEEIETQAEHISALNENLEGLVVLRTLELEKKNKALEDYAFINAHKLRAPVASLLGLIHLLGKADLKGDAGNIIGHMKDSADKLDDVVRTITRAIEAGDRDKQA